MTCSIFGLDCIKVLCPLLIFDRVDFYDICFLYGLGFRDVFNCVSILSEEGFVGFDDSFVWILEAGRKACTGDLGDGWWIIVISSDDLPTYFGFFGIGGEIYVSPLNRFLLEYVEPFFEHIFVSRHSFNLYRFLLRRMPFRKFFIAGRVLDRIEASINSIGTVVERDRVLKYILASMEMFLKHFNEALSMLGFDKVSINIGRDIGLEDVLKLYKYMREIYGNLLEKARDRFR